MRSEIELRLPPEPIAPILARAAVTAIGSGLPASVVSDAELLTSEVVSNAVKHADLDPSQKIVLRVADGRAPPDRGRGSRSAVRSRPAETELGHGWLGSVPDRSDRDVVGGRTRGRRQEGLVRAGRRPRSTYVTFACPGSEPFMRGEPGIVDTVQVRDRSVDPHEVQHPPHPLLFTVQDEASPPPQGHRRAQEGADAGGVHERELAEVDQDRPSLLDGRSQHLVELGLVAHVQLAGQADGPALFDRKQLHDRSVPLP